MKFKKLIYQSSTLFLSLMLLPVFVFQSQAQSGTSSVRGTIQDAQGEIVAGANVTLRSEAKGFSRTQVTNDSGNFVFTAVPPDTYSIEVESAGFKKTVLPKVEALIDTPKEVNVMLEVGNVAETVTVSTSTEAPINTTDASIGNTFDQRQVIQLPLSSRETAGLLSLQPGVTSTGEVNGGRSDQANITLDGVDVNEQQGGQAFFTVLRVTPESLQEFRVTTTNANADTGRSSGAQVSLITRSGNNEFHGSGYLYYRPGKFLQANDFFNNKAGIGQLSDKRQNYGGSILGPIIKNRLFFSAFYERFVEDAEDSVVREVPLTSLGQGIVRYRTASGVNDPTCPAGTPGGVRCLNVTQINAAYTAANGVTPGINPIALNVLAQAATRYKVNDTTVGDGLNTGGFRFNALRPVRNNVFTTRLDGKINDNQNVFAKYQYQYDNGTRAASRFPDTIIPPSWVHPQGLAAGHIWNLSSNKVNRFTYGFTRDSFTLDGDSIQNFYSFRFIYQPLNFSRKLSRITPVHNFVDDFTWVLGNHTISTGANVRLISNKRTAFGASYDNASTNPSFYDASGDVVISDDDGNPIFSDVSGASSIDLRDALTAVIGRFSQYGANLQYGKDGQLLPLGQGISRTFKTQEYEAYIQDSWRIRNNLTVNYGVRWSTSTPVYEANGLQVKPTTSLSDFFNRRVAAAYNGQSDNELLSVDLAGKANGRSGYYKQDWNNFAPALSAAWSPNFKSGFLKHLFGESKSTIRGGFRMTYDRIGSALAVAFDLNSTLGFTSTKAIAANTYNVSTNLGPLFTGIGQNIRNATFFPTAGSLPNTIRFPLQTPADEDQRIEQSLDDKLTTPYNYNYNLSYGRDLGKGYVVEVSYVGRIAKKLLVSRDSAHFNNLRDPASGQDFYSTIRQLIQYRQANASITSIPNIAWVQRFVPGLAGTYNVNGVPTVLTASQAAYRRVARSCSNNAARLPNGTCPAGSVSINGRNTTDFTFVQLLWDDGLGAGNNLFIHPQYATFAAYSTIGSSVYNGLQLSFRKRFRDDFQFDVNYTYSHSIDDASGTESSNTISSGASLILNPLDLKENRASSDFDVRHLVNANVVYGLPFGNGKMFFGNSKGLVNQILGGWQLTGIVRFNTGLPAGEPFDDGRWATNWNVQSNGVAVRRIQSSPTRTGEPNLFSDPTAAYQSYRNALPGEAGDRNILRDPGYIAVDAGLYKSFSIAEKQKITFRLEVFNVSNTQRFTGIANFALAQEPNVSGSQGSTPPADFGRFTQIQGKPRTVQFAVRYDF